MLRIRLIEGNFPDYERLLPSGQPHRAVLNRANLVDAIGRASLVADNHIPVVMKFTSGDGVLLTASRSDVGQESETVEGTYEGEESDLTVAFNHRYLHEGVSALGSDHVELGFDDAFKPCIIRGIGDAAFLYLLMPIRI